MRHRFFLSAFLAASVSFLAPGAHAAAPQHLWSHRFGDSASQSARTVAIDRFGGIVMAGEFSGSVDFGDGLLTSAGGSDIFLARFNPDGSIQASRRYGDVWDAQRATRVAVDSDRNVCVAGFFSGSVDFGGGALTSAGSNDAFVACFDPALTHIWSRRFGDGDGQFARSVAFDRTSNVYVCGYFAGSIDFGGGPLVASGFDDVFLARLDAGGNHVWSKRFGNTSGQEALDVATDPSGNVIIVGQFLGSIDFGGSSLTAQGIDAFIAKFSPAGSHLWSKRFGSTLPQSILAVATDADGDIYLAGTFNNTIDFGGGALTSAGADDAFLAKLDAGGNHLWSRRFGDASATQLATALAIDPTQRVTVGGYFRGSADFGTGVLTSAGLEDLFLAHFGPDGTVEWSARYGDASAQFMEALAADPFGDRVLAGNFAGTVDFGGGNLTSAGAEDVFLARLNSWTLTGASPSVIRAAELRAFPNPCNPSTTLEASLPRSGPADLSIHDASGRRVARVFDGVLPAGVTALHWSAVGPSGENLPSGVYFARLTYPGGAVTRKLVLLK